MNHPPELTIRLLSTWSASGPNHKCVFANRLAPCEDCSVKPLKSEHAQTVSLRTEVLVAVPVD